VIPGTTYDSRHARWTIADKERHIADFPLGTIFFTEHAPDDISPSNKQKTKLERWSVFHISLSLSLASPKYYGRAPISISGLHDFIMRARSGERLEGENACPYEPTYLGADKTTVNRNAPAKKKRTGKGRAMHR
jgi:hypothetical protein